MRNGATIGFLRVLAVTFTLGAVGRGQQAEELDAAVTEALRGAVRALQPDAEPAALWPAFAIYADALGDRDEAPVLRAVAALLRAEREWGRVTGSVDLAPVVQSVLDRRASDAPVLLLPALLALTRAVPDDPRLQWQLAESWGTASALRDAGKALLAVARLELLLGGEDVGESTAQRRLREVLQWVGAAGDGLQGVGLVFGALTSMRCVLEDGDPLRRLSAADLDVLRLLDDARTARARGKQKEFVAAVRSLAERQPQHPAWPLLLGQTHASVGPERSLTLAQNQLQLFLRLSEPGGAPPAVSPATPAAAPPPSWTLGEVRAALRVLGVGWPPQGMFELRLGARALAERALDKTLVELLHPDRDEVERRLARLQRQLVTKERKRATAEQELAEGQRDCEEARRKYEAAKDSPGTRTGGRRPSFEVDVSDLHDAWQTARRNLDKRTRNLARWQQECEEDGAAVAAFERCLQEFAAADR
ncbi:MAG: hypothetical protein AB7O97_11390 [Planctomycetota bacterium]